MRAFDIASGKLPKQAPEPCSDAIGLPRQRFDLRLKLYEGRAPDLPKLDARSLEPVTGVLVHGSIATGDACAFSDVDVAVIVNDRDQFAENQHRAAISELRRLLHAILSYDALMHHGLMFFPASGLDCYDQGFLPIEALACARVLYGPRELTLHEAPEQAGGFREALLAAVASLRRHFAQMDFVRDDYRFKSLISGVLLMPARVLAARGTHVYKRDSFQLARGLFSAGEWDLVGRCEALRAMWIRPKATMLQRGVPGRSHPRARQALSSRFAPHLNVRRLSPRMIEGLSRSAGRFFDRVEAIA